MVRTTHDAKSAFTVTFLASPFWPVSRLRLPKSERASSSLAPDVVSVTCAKRRNLSQYPAVSRYRVPGWGEPAVGNWCPPAARYCVSPAAGELPGETPKVTRQGLITVAFPYGHGSTGQPRIKSLWTALSSVKVRCRAACSRFRGVGAHKSLIIKTCPEFQITLLNLR